MATVPSLPHTDKPTQTQLAHILLVEENANYSLWRIRNDDLEHIMDCHNFATASYWRIKSYPNAEILDHKAKQIRKN